MNNSLPPGFDINVIPDEQCESCSGTHWKTIFTLKKIPASISPMQKESLMPVPCFACDSCGHIKNITT